MQSYFTILHKLAGSKRISLKQAFVKAGVQDSTYYRAEQGCELRYETAKKVYEYLNASTKQAHQKET